MQDPQERSAYTKYGRPLFFGVVGLVILTALYYLAHQEFAPGEALPRDITKIQDELPAQSVSVTTEQKHAYSVPASHPKYLKIDRLGVDTRVISVGVTHDGALDAPKTAWDAGWYENSATPGSAGAMLIDGHVNDNRNTLGVFGKLKDIAYGDEMSIERGDGQIFHYKVIKREQVPAGEVDMSQMLRPVSAGKAGLNLITCGGIYDARKGSYDDRILVFSEQL
jgi:sortase (surface protein transpeptidase)